MKAKATDRSMDRIRAALADEIGISEGQLSKLLNGELRRLCQILEALGIEVVPTDYLTSIERVLKERL